MRTKHWQGLYGRVEACLEAGLDQASMCENSGRGCMEESRPVSRPASTHWPGLCGRGKPCPEASFDVAMERQIYRGVKAP